MLTIFVWLAAVVIVVAGLEWWENLVIAISAIPIAIMANTMRITTAGMLYGVSPEVAEGFHDSTPAAILMMGVAVGLHPAGNEAAVVRDRHRRIHAGDVPAAGGGRPALAGAGREKRDFRWFPGKTPASGKAGDSGGKMG